MKKLELVGYLAGRRPPHEATCHSADTTSVTGVGVRRNRTKRHVATLLTMVVAGTAIGAEPAQPGPRRCRARAFVQTIAGNAGRPLHRGDGPRRTTRAVQPARHHLGRPAAPVSAASCRSAPATRTGQWSRGRPLEADGTAAGGDREARPTALGRRVGRRSRPGSPARATLPAGLRVDLINPASPGTPAPAAYGGQPRRIDRPAHPPGPRMITRAGWGANESIVKAAPEYTGPTEVFFVHHTATGNGYRCAHRRHRPGHPGLPGAQQGLGRHRLQLPGRQVRHDLRGPGRWGRAAVLGAHTLGFNNDASAIAVIGTYDAAGVTPGCAPRSRPSRPTSWARTATRRTAGRARLSGGSNRYAKGRPVTFYRISGHRDAGRTDCPGDALYAQLPSIRAIAGAARPGCVRCG